MSNESTIIKIEIKSKVFSGLNHCAEIDLHCDEIINYDELESGPESMPNLNTYPRSLDIWRCCNGNFTRFSNIIDHIEHNHLLYRQEIVGRTQSGHAYKYLCDQCGAQSFSFYKAILHHLSRHVIFKIFCSQCLVVQTEAHFHQHIRACNLMENDLSSNSQD